MPSKPGRQPGRATPPASTPAWARGRRGSRADDPEQPGDRELEAPVAVRLEAEDRERDDGGDQARGEQRDAEQQVERDRGADELGEVGGDGDHLRLHPEPQVTGRGKRSRHSSGRLRPVAMPDLGRQVLHEHRHQVRGDDHPDEQVAVARRRRRCWSRSCPGRCRRRRPRRPGRAARARSAPAGAQPPQGAGLGRVGSAWPRQPRGRLERGRRVHARSSHADRAPARRRARATRRRSARTAGRRTAALEHLEARAGRDPALGEIAQHLGVGVGDAHEHAARARLQRERGAGRSSSTSSADGIGSPCGSCVGLPSLAAISASSSSERACSSTSASSCTRSHGTPSDCAR